MNNGKYYTLYTTLNPADVGSAARWETVATTSGASAASAAIAARRIMITTAGAPHYFVFGAAPTATTAGFLIPANTSMMFNFNSGDKVAGIQSSGAASAFCVVDLD